MLMASLTDQGSYDVRFCAVKGKYCFVRFPSSSVQALSVLTKASVWYEMRVLWAIINHVKSHGMALAFILQTEIN